MSILSTLFSLVLCMNNLKTAASVLATRIFEYSIQEGQPEGLLIGDVGRDSHNWIKSFYENNNDLRFLLTKHNPWLQIDSRSGILTTKLSVDLEELCSSRSQCPTGKGVLSTSVNVQKQDSAENTHIVALITVNIMVEDINDFGPHFGGTKVFHKTILEMQCIHVPTNCLLREFALPVAIDGDFSTKYNTLTYELNRKSQTFALKMNNGEPYMELLEGLDYETHKEYEFVLIAKDSQGKSAIIDVKIIILDFNDNVPTFSQSSYETTISESVEIGTIIYKLTATDKDSVSDELKFEIKDAHIVEFNVDNNGFVKTMMRLDFERIKRYEISLIVRDSLYSDVAKLIVHITDTNDNAPEWKQPGTLSVSENSPPAFISVVSVWDKDSGMNGQVVCPDVDEKVVSSSGLTFRKRNGETNVFDLKTTREFDREHEPHVTAYLVCYDQGTPSLTSTLSQVVQVTDRNDNAPQFIKNVFLGSIKENLPQGFSVTQVVASDADADENGKIHYRFLPSKFNNIFTIENGTGRITILEPLDREVRSYYYLQVLAVDGGKPHALTGTTFVNVTVLDENDNSPYFVGKERFHITEHKMAPFILGKLEAIDPDMSMNGRVQFEQLFGSFRNKFRVYPNGTIEVIGQFDREVLEERKEHVYVCVCVMDLGFGKSRCGSPGTMFSIKNFSIIVDDINDNEPKFILPTNFSSPLSISINTHAAGDRVVQVNAIDRDTHENGRVRYTLEFSENFFIIDSRSGLITLTRKLTKYDLKLCNLIVRATDHGNPSRSSSNVLRVLITDAPAEVGLTVEKAAEIQTRRNITVIVVLASVSGVLALILIMAIVCVNQSFCRLHNRRATPHISKYLPSYQQNNTINEDMNVDAADQAAAVGDGLDLMMHKWPLSSSGVQCFESLSLNSTQNPAAFVGIRNSCATLPLNDVKSSMCVDKLALCASEVRHFSTLGKRVNTNLCAANSQNATTGRIDKPASSDQVKFWLYQIQEDAQVAGGIYNGPPCGGEIRCPAGVELADSVLSDSGRGCSDEDLSGLYATHQQHFGNCNTFCLGCNRASSQSFHPMQMCVTQGRSCTDHITDMKHYSGCHHFSAPVEPPSYVSSMRSASFTMLDDSRSQHHQPQQPQQRTPATLRRLRAAIRTPSPAGLTEVNIGTTQATRIDGEEQSHDN